MIRLVLERPGLVPVLMAFNQPVVVVGRGTAGDGGPEIDWRLPFADVSRRQCRFSQVAERTYVEGLSPRNPTRVNQREVEGLTRLHPGDLVSFGGCVVRLAGEDVRERTPVARLAAAPRPASARAGREEEAVSEDMSSILERASRWAAHGHPPALLLGGAELRRGRAWLRGGAELGEAGALARRYVEASLRTRRARAQRAIAGAAAAVLAIGGGSAAARGVLGPWAIEPVIGGGRPFEDGCRRDALVRAEEVLRAAGSEGDGEDGLLMSGYALRIAERGGCVPSSRAEAVVRERLAARRDRVVGRHAGAITAVALGGDGHAIASADARGRVRLWDGAGGPPIELGEGDGPTERLAFSADGRWLVAGGGAGELRVWDLRGEVAGEPRRLVGHRAAIAGIAFDAAGALLATSDRRGALRLWDMSGETVVAVGEHVEAAGAIEDMVFEAGRLFGRAGGRVLAWRAHPAGAERRLGAREALPTGASVTAFAVVGPRVITGDAAGELVVWRAGRAGWTGRPAGRHGGPVARVRAVAGRPAAVSLGRDGGLMLVELAAPVRRDGTPLVYAFAPLASAADDLVVETSGRRALTIGDELAVWDLALRRAEPLARLGEASVTAVAGAGAWAATGGEDGVVRAWALRVDGGGAGAHTLAEHVSDVVSLALAGGGTALASAGRDEAVRVWRVDRDGVPAPQGVLRPPRAVDRVALSEDGRWLAGSSGRGLHLWDLDAAGREPLELIGHAEAIRELRFAGSGWLVSLDLAGEIHFWRVTPGGPEQSSRRTSLPLGVWALAAADEYLAVGTGSSDGASGRTYVWPIGAPWDEEARIAEHSRPVTALAFSADGRRVASGSADGGVRTAARSDGRWRAGRPYDHGQSVRALAFARRAGGTLAIGGADGVIAVHEPEAGGEPRRFVAHAAAITGLAFGTDGSRLVSASQDGELKAWRLGDGEEPPALPLVGHRGPIFELQADREGRVVVTAGDDATVRVWPLEPAGLIRLACMTAGRDLAPDVWRRALPGAPPDALCAGGDGW